MYKVTGHFFAPCRRNEETKQTSGLPRLFLCFCMEPRSSEQPPALPAGGREAAEGQAVKRKNGFLSDRGGLRIWEKTPHETAAKVSPLRSGSVSEPAVQEQHTPDPQPVRVKEHRQLLPICQQLQPSSAAWCSPPPSQMAGRTPHAVSY